MPNVPAWLHALKRQPQLLLYCIPMQYPQLHRLRLQYDNMSGLQNALSHLQRDEQNMRNPMQQGQLRNLSQLCSILRKMQARLRCRIRLWNMLRSQFFTLHFGRFRLGQFLMLAMLTKIRCQPCHLGLVPARLP
jgi:hypothetical protein